LSSVAIVLNQIDLLPGGHMEKKDVKITIDVNGNIRREIVDQTQQEERKSRFLKKLVSSLPI